MKAAVMKAAVMKAAVMKAAVMKAAIKMNPRLFTPGFLSWKRTFTNEKDQDQFLAS
jgi:hypothetical protein